LKLSSFILQGTFKLHLVNKKEELNKFSATHIFIPANDSFNNIHKPICILNTSLELFESSLEDIGHGHRCIKQRTWTLLYPQDAAKNAYRT
jgi:hypothetical protein